MSPAGSSPPSSPSRRRRRLGVRAQVGARRRQVRLAAAQARLARRRERGWRWGGRERSRRPELIEGRRGRRGGGRRGAGTVIGAVVVDGDGLVVDLGWCRRPSRARREREMSGGTAAGGRRPRGTRGLCAGGCCRVAGRCRRPEAAGELERVTGRDEESERCARAPFAERSLRRPRPSLDHTPALCCSTKAVGCVPSRVLPSTAQAASPSPLRAPPRRRRSPHPLVSAPRRRPPAPLAPRPQKQHSTVDYPTAPAARPTPTSQQHEVRRVPSAAPLAGLPLAHASVPFGRGREAEQAHDCAHAQASRPKAADGSRRRARGRVLLLGALERRIRSRLVDKGPAFRTSIRGACCRTWRSCSKAPAPCCALRPSSTTLAASAPHGQHLARRRQAYVLSRHRTLATSQQAVDTPGTPLSCDSRSWGSSGPARWLFFRRARRAQRGGNYPASERVGTEVPAAVGGGARRWRACSQRSSERQLWGASGAPRR